MMDDYQFQMAWRYYHRNQFDLAINNLRGLLAHEPNTASYHGLLAACLLAQTRIHAAEYELKIALSLDAHDPFFFLIYSRIYTLQNKPTLALNSCTEALNLDPKNTEALLLKADILLMANKRKEALDCITTAASIEPDIFAVSLAFGDYYQQIGQHHQALEYALQALSYDAGHEDAHILMAEVQLAVGNQGEIEL
jgi:predicted Zn-dependent protease